MSVAGSPSVRTSPCSPPGQPGESTTRDFSTRGSVEPSSLWDNGPQHLRIKRIPAVLGPVPSPSLRPWRLPALLILFLMHKVLIQKPVAMGCCLATASERQDQGKSPASIAEEDEAGALSLPLCLCSGPNHRFWWPDPKQAPSVSPACPALSYLFLIPAPDSHRMA